LQVYSASVCCIYSLNLADLNMASTVSAGVYGNAGFFATVDFGSVAVKAAYDTFLVGADGNFVNRSLACITGKRAAL